MTSLDGLILAVIAAYLVQVMVVTPALYYRQAWLPGRPAWAELVRLALLPRDQPLPTDRIVVRAQRADANFQQSLVAFVGLAVVLRGDTGSAALASLGAAVFLAARIAYLPCYLLGLAPWRSVVWLIGAAGLVVMLAAALV